MVVVVIKLRVPKLRLGLFALRDIAMITEFFWVLYLVIFICKKVLTKKYLRRANKKFLRKNIYGVTTKILA